MYMFELMGDVCPCGGGCSRYWHAVGHVWGAELTNEEFDFELPDGVVLHGWGESGCTQGLALYIEEADWWGHLGGNLSDGDTREILQWLRKTTWEEMLQWTIESPNGW
jgi:hypothetical protein